MNCSTALCEGEAMNKHSDIAIKILNELHTERLDYCSEYLPLIDAANRLAHYEDLEEQGRLVELPCKPSDVTVYQLRDKKHAKGVGVSPRHISCAMVWSDGTYILTHQGANACKSSDFGKTWFLTRAEAEAALKGRCKNETD